MADSEHAHSPDDTDWAIMGILADEQTSNNEIARQLDLSEGTVRQRIRKLREAGILRVRGLTNPEALENRQLAYITANVSESSLLETKAREISTLPQVLSVAILAGQYDLMVEVLVDSNKGLVEFITGQLSKIKGIAKTETHLSLKTYNKYV
ncbi:MAG: Lrp/AsnC family transcriptional regulator [Planctomycetes bacterium]|nr:Lrp/AsnC family transcriptional regulator [Planctomycetota bacterium]